MTELRLSAIERAYELARSGQVDGINAILDMLAAEGYPNANAQLYGPVLRKDLRDLCVKARRSG